MSDHDEPTPDATETLEEIANRADAIHLSAADKEKLNKGPLAWMTRNAVAANILMVFLLVGGYFYLPQIKKEVFPEIELDLIVVNVPYPGASPAEVEQGVLLAAEESVRGIDGVKEVRSTATEGFGVLSIELLLGTDPEQALNDVKAAVDRVTSFPEDAERPIVFKPSNRLEVLSLVLYGDVDEKSLRALGEKARNGLLQDPDITFVDLGGVRALEVSIEVPQAELRKHQITLDQIAQLVRGASVELPGGRLKTKGGEVLLRTSERRDLGRDFENVTLLSGSDGTVVRVGDIATVKDGFAETDEAAKFYGKRAVMVRVYRTGDQTPIDVSDAVTAYAERIRDSLPPGVQVATWFDMSEWYEGRIDLLLRNAAIGLLLVVLVLGIFLEMKLAFWVTLGIPITFIGSLLFLPGTGVSINMISLFAFILVLGMVVDDAIIVGESVYRYRLAGHTRIEAAVHGVRDVAAPVIFAILTTIFAYLPMLFVPGIMGKFFRVIPIVVIAVLLLSLMESLLILPAHLAHSSKIARTGPFAWLDRRQQSFSRAFERLIRQRYVPIVRFCSRRRYLTLASGIAMLVITVGLVVGGRVEFIFFPKIDGDVIIASAELPYGTSIDRTRELEQMMLDAAEEILDDSGGTARITRGIYSQVGAGGLAARGDPGRATRPGGGGGSIAEVAIFMVESSKRSILTSEFAHRWREKVENKAYGLEGLSFNFGMGPPVGSGVHVQLNHKDPAVLQRAAADLAKRVSSFAGIYDIDDGFAIGKRQLDFKLTAEGRSLGLTEIELARQVRAAFFGAEAVRQQRGRDEVRTYVRLPLEERDSEYNVEELMLRAPNGGDIPMAQAATISRGRSYTEINRIDGRRAVTVTAEVDNATGNANDINAALVKDTLPALLEEYPGLSYTFGGEQQQQAETMESLGRGFSLALLGMFALLAVAFRSYVQPLIVLLAIPFGFVGAVLGHLIMGYELSLMSMMGVVALAGVVVNDSLILVVAINRYRAAGMNIIDAVAAGGERRFRPILLTSLTTFFGLAPMIVETSVQAKFLIPMAVSLGFGVIFATFITLVLVPAAYVALDDLQRIVSGAWSTLNKTQGRQQPNQAATEDPR